MTQTLPTPSDWKPIRNFTAYAMSPSGDVYRVRRSARGPFAIITEPKIILPVCHPRGTTWHLQMTSDDGKRHRIPVGRVRELAS